MWLAVNREIMKIVTNTPGQETFANELSPLVSWCDQAIFIATFFVDDSWVRRLIQEGKVVKVVVSLRPPTSPKALERILMLNANVEVRFLGRELHSKIYAFARGDDRSWHPDDFQCQTAIGSSNLTYAGFNHNIETNVLLDGEAAKEGFKQAHDIFENAHPLTSSVLEQYSEEFGEFIETEFPEIHASPVQLSAGYERIATGVKYITRLCEETIASNYPNIPPFLVVDHFWHFIVVICSAERDAITEKVETEGQIDAVIRDLFRRYVDWERNEEVSYVEEMNDRSLTLKTLLKKSNLTIDEMKTLYLCFHATRYVEERYTQKVDGFIEKNDPKHVLKALNHLADESLDITQRIGDLRKKEWKLYGFGDSAIKEFNGWRYPTNYPIWNKKSEQALRILGFK